jgi:hypothetical protein
MTADPAAERIDEHLVEIDDQEALALAQREPNILAVSEWTWRAWANRHGRPHDRDTYMAAWLAAYELVYGELDGDRLPF